MALEVLDFQKVDDHDAGHFCQRDRLAEAEFCVVGRPVTVDSRPEAGADCALGEGFLPIVLVGHVVGDALVGRHGAINKALDVAYAKDAVFAVRVFLVQRTMGDQFLGRQRFHCPRVTRDRGEGDDTDGEPG